LKPLDKFVLYSDGAEPLIGSFDDSSGFSFSQQFSQLNKLPIQEMMERFGKLALNRRIDFSELDDITLVGFELI
jgi:hypothetical protein